MAQLIQLVGAEVAFQPQQQAIVAVARVVDRLVVDQQRVHDPADLNELVPFSIVPGEPGNFYILHAPFSQERITYDRSTKTIRCESRKNTQEGVTVVALDWLAGLVMHRPEKGQQLLRFYGRYSNACRGGRSK